RGISGVREAVVSAAKGTAVAATAGAAVVGGIAMATKLSSVAAGAAALLLGPWLAAAPRADRPPEGARATAVAPVAPARPLPVAPGGSRPADSALEAGLARSGTIVDPAGRPVPGLAVFVVARKVTTSVWSGELFENDDSRLGSSTSPYQEARARTGADGRF